MELFASQGHHRPYCSEEIEFTIDCSILQQKHVEDCQVCCQPIIAITEVGDDCSAQLRVRGKDDWRLLLLNHGQAIDHVRHYTRPAYSLYPV